MFRILQIVGLISTALSLLAVGQLRRRSYFQVYPLLSLFLVAQFLTDIAQWAQFMALNSLTSSGYRTLYYTTEFALQFLMTAVMISFIYGALDGDPARGRTLALLSIGVFGVAIASVFGVRPAIIGSMRIASVLTRNLSFASVLLNVFVWQSLMKHRRLDVQLLLLALGAGFWTTGRAVGHSLRLMNAGSGGDAVVVITELLSLCVWYWALHRFSPRARDPQSSQPTTPA